MAVRQRIFNSTAPFCGSPQTELKGSYLSCSSTEQEVAEEEEEEEEEGEKDRKMNYHAKWSTITKLLTHGTAEQMGEMPFKTTSIIAQAECETQDSQEFSPSCFKPSFLPTPNCFTISVPPEHNNVACPSSASVQELNCSSVRLISKKKKRQKQKGRKKFEKKAAKKAAKQRQRHPTSSGVPEQESGTSRIQILEPSHVGPSSDHSSSCCSSSEDQGGGLTPFSRHIYPTGSSCSPLHWPLQKVSSSYEQDSSSDSLSSIGDCSLALAGLRGSVSQGDPCYAGPFFREVEGEAREDEDRLSEDDSFCSEGLIFYNENIEPVDSEYREGHEYKISQFIKEGSYGEVLAAQDVQTRFKFAVKKIPLMKFSSEEVGAWSTLTHPHVVKLFGVIKEGPTVILLMDHKSGSVGQLITERGRLPEDLSLHYHSQVLTALEYLVKKKVAHLDVKADNVLLSEDGRDTFLCDFGHAERLDHLGQCLSGSKDLKGTDTHMAPEVVKGDLRGAKADVWSSCCMLLHMLNGCQPWTRYYTCRLYLKIAYEPPPLREIPPDCRRLTAEVLEAGLHKDPTKRLSASKLKEKTERALREVGGLSSPVKGPYTEPLSVTNKPPDPCALRSSSVELDDAENMDSHGTPIKSHKKCIKWENEAAVEAESKQCLPVSPITLIQEPIKRGSKVSTGPELELCKLERDFYLSSLSQLHSAEMQEQLLSCLSSETYSNWEPFDVKDSGRWSMNPADDLSSGVFSYSSLSDVQLFSMDLLGQTHEPSPSCFEGVDVCIRDFSRRSIRIREMRRVKVGHIATGISDQISENVFTLETQQGQPIAHDEEVQESGLELCCVPAPDSSHCWRWRIRHGVLETR
ncbi:mitogen-activated protein kinase kinase kinase 14 [Gouania willdenowi]|uniref:Mitogen-activated protein kinase kinase kinase 14-like n=1 Tax=Gouania willdenowi TaxID=441366 RepID=A0A8C5EPC2_GOUWI|nr:mitogen-activated protein kinase kinase kinase 14-like [Gouania willdenowi]XP_028311652.1 mitogen-activated protein kinase kinase kinase 14-like [Gouania willdenowi]XP_028311653.1 mitogen-activated protein kinase kinase kinase 14-like [Gouania willdenowi]